MAPESLLSEAKPSPMTQVTCSMVPTSKKLWDHFKKWAEPLNAFRVLDYGCGKAKHLYKPYLEGKTFHSFFAGKVQEYYLYDPGNRLYLKQPAAGSRFNALICADVMEHVPEQYVEKTIEDMRMWLDPSGTAFFSISGQTAKKSFDDGENLHVNVQPIEYWILKLKHLHRRYVMVYTGDAGVTTYSRV